MKFTTLTVDPDADEVRVDELYGQTHIVAPVVMVTEGVLKNGYLPADQIERSANGWNGRPITAPPAPDTDAHAALPDDLPDGMSGHPLDSDGEFVSANQAPYANDMRIGEVRGVETADGDRTKLVGEAWLNVDRVKAVGEYASQVAQALVDGDPLDVSIGFWHDQKDRAGTFADEEYEFVVHDIMPDHLAMLPNETGECSWDDGCGVPRAASATAMADIESIPDVSCPRAASGGRSPLFARSEPPMQSNLYDGGKYARSSPRTPTWSEKLPEGEGPSWSEVDLSFAAFRDAYAEDNPDASAWTDLSQAERTSMAARSLNGEPDADTFDQGVVLPVVVPESDALSEAGLMAALSRAPQTDGINSDETQARIRSLLESEFDRDLESEAMSIFARLKHAFGIGDDGDDGPNDPTNETMTEDFDLDALAEATGIAKDTLESMSEDDLAALEETVNDGDADDDPEDDDPEDVPADDGGAASEEVVEAVESLSERIDTIEETLEEQQSPDLSGHVDVITSATDKTEDELDDWPADAVRSYANQLRTEAAGIDAMNRGRVNRVAQAGGRKVDEDESDASEETASVGALSSMKDNGGEN